ncbi:hypothetical protein P7C70_g689, partial [Phenoliferia sp. Uapishka_3]
MPSENGEVLTCSFVFRLSDGSYVSMSGSTWWKEGKGSGATWSRQRRRGTFRFHYHHEVESSSPTFGRSQQPPTTHIISPTLAQELTRTTKRGNKVDATNAWEGPGVQEVTLLHSSRRRCHCHLRAAHLVGPFACFLLLSQTDATRLPSSSALRIVGAVPSLYHSPTSAPTYQKPSTAPIPRPNPPEKVESKGESTAERVARAAEEALENAWGLENQEKEKEKVDDPEKLAKPRSSGMSAEDLAAAQLRHARLMKEVADMGADDLTEMLNEAYRKERAA